MKLTQDMEGKENHTNLSIVYMTIGGITFLILLMLFVAYINQRPKTVSEQKNQNGSQNYDLSISKNDEGNIEDKLTADDLDFWNMYKQDEKQVIANGNRTSLYKDRAKQIMQETLSENKAKEDDLSEGKTKTEVIYPDGKKEWILIDKKLKKNNYDYKDLVAQGPLLKYYVNGEQVSKYGVIVPMETTTLDFVKLKNSGVDFAMITVGSRGFSTGTITQNNNWKELVTNAKAADLKVGLLFQTQAITADEASEEASVILDQLRGYEIDYPIGIWIESVNYENQRTQSLTKEQVTLVSEQFCKEVKSAGYIPLIYADSYQLLMRMDISKLSAYDIMLDQIADVPSYPYQFMMWNNSNQSIVGDQKNLKTCISFVDYSLR